MPRIRILFSKRGPFCFIRHVELPQIFSRSAVRAGLSIDLTEGFSPHPRISLGPALPVGVVACAEPAEIWFGGWEDTSMERFNDSLPSGLSVIAAERVDGKALNKLCEAGEYIVHIPCLDAWNRFLSFMKNGENPWGDSLLKWNEGERTMSMILSSPSQNGPGQIVKKLIEIGIIGGWADIRLARLSVGSWDPASERVCSLVEVASETLAFGER